MLRVIHFFLVIAGTVCLVISLKKGLESARDGRVVCAIISPYDGLAALAFQKKAVESYKKSCFVVFVTPEKISLVCLLVRKQIRIFSYIKSLSFFSKVSSELAR